MLAELANFPTRTFLFHGEVIWGWWWEKDKDSARDMFHGFRMLGPLTPGSAWQLRTDAKYARPIGFEQFKAFNAAHARTLAHTAARTNTRIKYVLRLRRKRSLAASVGRGPASA